LPGKLRFGGAIVDEFPDANKAPAFFAPFETIICLCLRPLNKLFSFILGIFLGVV
jgi:hypothetical protein